MVALRTLTVVVLAVLGGLLEFGVALRWYEPTVTEDDEESPRQALLLESAVFLVGFAIAFAVAGAVLSVFARFVSPLDLLALLGVVAVGCYSAYTTYAGERGKGHKEGTRMMGATAGGWIALMALAMLFV